MLAAGGVIVKEDCPVVDFFQKADSVMLWKNGNCTELPVGSSAYGAFFACLDEMLADARQMPAFGVSIDSFTRKEREEGFWVEFSFLGEEECEGMPFEGLLFSVKKENCGFNVIRLYHGKYEGRCFYVDLNGGNMAALENFMRDSFHE